MLIQTNDTQEVRVDFDMFTPEEYSYIHLFVETELHRFQTENHRDVWDPRLFEHTVGNNKVTLIDDDDFNSFVIKRVMERFESTNDFSKYNVLFYQSQGQYNVNWHDDGNFAGAASIYLNDQWNRTLGGHFMYQMHHQQVMTAIQPKQGTAVYQRGGVLHTTTPVSPIAPSRKSLQVFIHE